MTKFNKAKLAKVWKKKAKGGLTSDLLTRKCQRDMETPKDNPMLTSPIAKSVTQHPASPISSLELIASTNGSSKPKGKDKAPPPPSPGSFWDDARVAVLKAHKAISIDDLSPLRVRPSHELMSSHVHKVIHVQIVNEGFAFLSLCSFLSCLLLFSASFRWILVHSGEVLLRRSMWRLNLRWNLFLGRTSCSRVRSLPLLT